MNTLHNRHRHPASPHRNLLVLAHLPRSFVTRRSRLPLGSRATIARREGREVDLIIAHHAHVRRGEDVFEQVVPLDADEFLVIVKGNSEPSVFHLAGNGANFTVELRGREVAEPDKTNNATQRQIRERLQQRRTGARGGRRRRTRELQAAGRRGLQLRDPAIEEGERLEHLFLQGVHHILDIAEHRQRALFEEADDICEGGTAAVLAHCIVLELAARQGVGDDTFQGSQALCQHVITMRHGEGQRSNRVLDLTHSHFDAKVDLGDVLEEGIQERGVTRRRGPQAPATRKTAKHTATFIPLSMRSIRLTSHFHTNLPLRRWDNQISNTTPLSGWDVNKVRLTSSISTIIPLSWWVVVDICPRRTSHHATTAKWDLCNRNTTRGGRDSTTDAQGRGRPKTKSTSAVMLGSVPNRHDGQVRLQLLVVTQPVFESS
mmetsp:Transcript_9801/g.26047  ORF Transcript_9801/g.26047 Transcript_9801/m.26047 type:complete len:432 (-) Transcript_9801:400-1695(-)